MKRIWLNTAEIPMLILSKGYDENFEKREFINDFPAKQI